MLIVVYLSVKYRPATDIVRKRPNIPVACRMPCLRRLRFRFKKLIWHYYIKEENTCFILIFTQPLRADRSRFAWYVNEKNENLMLLVWQFYTSFPRKLSTGFFVRLKRTFISGETTFYPDEIVPGLWAFWMLFWRFKMAPIISFTCCILRPRNHRTANDSIRKCLLRLHNNFRISVIKYRTWKSLKLRERCLKYENLQRARQKSESNRLGNWHGKHIRHIPVGIPIANHKMLGSLQWVSGTWISAWAIANERSACTPTRMASGGTLSRRPMAWQPWYERK